MEALRHNQLRFFNLRLAKKILILIIFVIIFDFYLFPAPIFAASIDTNSNTAVIEESIDYPQDTEYIEVKTYDEEIRDDQAVINNHLPDNKDSETLWSGYYSVTAYNSEIGQCDSTPCVSANGFNLCEHGIEDSIAANFLRFGTKVKIPEIFGDRVFIVRDRMNERYENRIDIWMKDKADAKKFGLKIAKIEVIE